MNLIDLKYHTSRIYNMLKIKGAKYTWEYFVFLTIYNSDFISEKILYPLFPASVYFPKYVEVEVSTACNLRCRMCEHTYWKEKNQMMTINQLKGIVDQFSGLKWIGLTGIGESFLNPDFSKMINLVKKKNIYLELYDSFFLIDKKQSKNLIKNKVDRMIVSLDAANQKTYEKIRKGAKFNLVISNIKGLRKLKLELRSYYPEITFHYIISKENIGEVPAFIDLVKEIMDGEMTSIYFTAILHPFSNIKKMVVEIPDTLVEEVSEKCRRYGIKVAWNRNISAVKESTKKCNEWTMPFIFVDGTVIPCCAGNEANMRNFQRKTSLGNIFNDSFKDIWESKPYIELRQMIHDGKVPLACKNCTIYKTR